MNINCPNLPQNMVKTVIMSPAFPKITERIGETGIKIIPSECLENALPFEKYHADMQVLPVSGDTAFVLKECESLQEKL